jgi:hypothetical protein
MQVATLSEPRLVVNVTGAFETVAWEVSRTVAVSFATLAVESGATLSLMLPTTAPAP